MKTEHNIGKRITAVVCIWLMLALSLAPLTIGATLAYGALASHNDVQQSLAIASANGWGSDLAITYRQTQDLTFSGAGPGESAQIILAGRCSIDLESKAAISLDYVVENDLHFNSPLIRLRLSSSDHSTEG